jgi:hypothetical protein
MNNQPSFPFNYYTPILPSLSNNFDINSNNITTFDVIDDDINKYSDEMSSLIKLFGNTKVLNSDEIRTTFKTIIIENIDALILALIKYYLNYDTLQGILNTYGLLKDNKELAVTPFDIRDNVNALTLEYLNKNKRKAMYKFIDYFDLNLDEDIPLETKFITTIQKLSNTVIVLILLSLDEITIKKSDIYFNLLQNIQREVQKKQREAQEKAEKEEKQRVEKEEKQRVEKVQQREAQQKEEKQREAEKVNVHQEKQHVGEYHAGEYQWKLREEEKQREQEEQAKKDNQAKKKKDNQAKKDNNKIKYNKKKKDNQGEGDYECAYCDKTFNVRSALMTHMTYSHNRSIMYFCDIKGCQAKYETIKNLRQHKNKTHHLYECPYCNETFKSNDDFNNHKYTDHEIYEVGNNNFITCKLCGFQNKNIIGFHQHYRLIHKK